jgi:hypothetical protein
VWVYKSSGTTKYPDSGSFQVNCTTCVRFTWNVVSHSLVPAYSNWPASSQNACSGDVATPNLRDSLGVYVEYRHSSLLGFFLNNVTVSESTVMWLEPWFSTPTCK